METIAFKSFLKNIAPKAFGVLGVSIPKSKFTAIDLSETNSTLNTVDVSSSEKLAVFVNHHININDAQVAFGGYLEVRTIYKRSEYFNSQAEEERNIHIGMDLWCPAETPIYAVFDATVHSFKNNTNFGDYGPTIILKHTIEGVPFYTLYGHLSLGSIADLEIGTPIKQGESFAVLGDASVNGDYPPHLHFQIIKDIQNYVGDYPGVCAKKDLEFYKNNCPNPNILLGL
ncbi:peptidoglycan DD-metalloendopeptidase family protein [Algibacter pacificus]|uniref:peptidoglycan DD-metalloendopeptidase family protein n=1 Tax=Algibacter pacificus TaxID=2599389 RepID=UPI0011CB8647|nr:peptidoglycan DD-metalloendopeptidase family protein [Algibacter pacificus]